jgi:choline dehydrogenase-like flavoprotein
MAEMIVDALRRGIEGGWKAYDASTFMQDHTYEADVAIVGTGAGGGTAAEILSDAGLRVILVEEGPLWTSTDFHMLERESYPNLYQESAGRKTKDKGINILQGRSVGGSTTVNWTTSLRTPSATLAYWRKRPRAMVRAHGSTAPRRAVGQASQRQQRRPAQRRGQTRHPDRNRSP